VTIDDRYRDATGNPRPVLSYNLSDHVKDGLAAAKRVASAIFAGLGAEEHTDHSPRDGLAPLGYFRYRDHDYVYKGAGYGAGTHIMGDDSKSSVVDSFQRCWDRPNLYAVGCGSMPSMPPLSTVTTSYSVNSAKSLTTSGSMRSSPDAPTARTTPPTRHPPALRSTCAGKMPT
jgi:choline dehydrogenase-like flavoprotein